MVRTSVGGSAAFPLTLEDRVVAARSNVAEMLGVPEKWVRISVDPVWETTDDN